MTAVNEVILVNEQDEMVGTMEKIEAHQKALLHRAFSVFILNGKGDMLLQRRALNKYHSAGLWTNTCCSHPYPGEETADGAHRRLREEMGFDVSLKKAFEFMYKSPYDNGLTEHEFDHVYIGTYEGTINPDPSEVADYCYMSSEAIEASLLSHPSKYTSWFHIAFPKVKAMMQTAGSAS